ncbi:Activator of Hsp90 ATPase 1 family protein [candidate division TM7 genomosp. GTL1]|nr:Activator of Hsp90 ATPase 1 family protein [candidate division TM7 genomosp. GTL1]
MNITSTISIQINAPREKVWRAITDPATVAQWFFGTSVESDWEAGRPIVFRGEWQGQSYEDTGTIKKIEPGKLLQYTHLSSRTGQTDMPENYEIVNFQLSGDGGQTTLTVHEENLPSAEAREKSIGLWRMALENLKKTVEK